MEVYPFWSCYIKCLAVCSNLSFGIYIFVIVHKQVVESDEDIAYWIPVEAGAV